MFTRDFFLNSLIRLRDNDFVKILTGIRRSGKSSLLELFKSWLIETGVSEKRIVSINYELAEMSALRQSEALHDYIKARASETSERLYILIDEIQEVEEWARVINSIRAGFNADIYVTGSNSRAFAGEHLTYMAGRYVEIKVYPLSLKEFMQFRGYKEKDVQKAYNEFVKIGGFPAVALTSDKFLQRTIIDGLFDSVFTRDIILRGKIKNEGAFLKVAKFVLDNIGSYVSANGIANTLKSQGHRITVDTIDNYLKLMCNAYVLYQCERYDLRGKERLRTNGKYYVADLALRNKLLGERNTNLGYVTENIVFLELKRRGYEVFVGKYNDLEIDFVAQRGDEKLYVQVALSALDESVLKREIEPFKYIKDKYPKLLITADAMDLSTDAFVHRNLYDFLLEEENGELI